MPSLYSKVRKVSGRDWGLFVSAICWTGIARILIVFVPLKRFSFLLGTHMKETPETAVSDNIGLLRALSIAISRASRFVPWRCKCYEQAISAKMILVERSGEKSSLYNSNERWAGAGCSRLRRSVSQWRRCVRHNSS